VSVLQTQEEEAERDDRKGEQKKDEDEEKETSVFSQCFTQVPPRLIINDDVTS
jgi:hypothetical protein